MRLFFAIPLPGDVIDRLTRFQACLKGSGVQASWAEPKGMHLTLAFLGEVEASKVPLLLDLARRCSETHRCFPLSTTYCGGFPRATAARVLWLGLEVRSELDQLCADLRAYLLDEGIPFDRKPFRPHLTLARFKGPMDLSALSEKPEVATFEAQALVLYQSLPAVSGTRYQEVGALPLAK